MIKNQISLKEIISQKDKKITAKELKNLRLYKINGYWHYAIGRICTHICDLETVVIPSEFLRNNNIKTWDDALRAITMIVHHLRTRL